MVASRETVMVLKRLARPLKRILPFLDWLASSAKPVCGLVLLLLAASCSPWSEGDALHGRLYLTKIDGKPVYYLNADRWPVSATFTRGKFSGSDGCNGVHGTYRTIGDQLRFSGEITSSMIYCTGSDRFRFGREMMFVLTHHPTFTRVRESAGDAYLFKASGDHSVWLSPGPIGSGR
jgi:heat shock protein HslJ